VTLLLVMAVCVGLLCKDELIFECRIRGYLPNSGDRLAELRAKLSELLKREEKGVDLEDRL